MRLQRRIIKPGDKQSFPKKGDMVIIEHSGWMYDARNSKDNYKGKQFDYRRPIEYPLGLGAAIKGMDTLLLQMSLGERTVWIISADLGYGKTGLPQVVPPDTDLVLEIELVAINGKKA